MEGGFLVRWEKEGREVNKTSVEGKIGGEGVGFSRERGRVWG